MGCEVEYSSASFNPADIYFYGDAQSSVPTEPQPRLRLNSAGGDIKVADDNAIDSGHYLAYQPLTATVPPTITSPILISATFDSDSDGFAYADDIFRNTNQPAYADGFWSATAGYTGGGLKVELGGIDPADIFDMSGGWQENFTLNTTSTILISFKYRLDQDESYDLNEYSMIKLSIDGTEQGLPSETGLGLMIAECEEGCDTGWQTYQTLVRGLSNGHHTFTLGGFNNQKTFNDEFTEIYFDDVEIIQLTTVVSATFDADSDGFSYADDTFRNTNQPNYASGVWTSTAGYAGGGLQVQVGGVDANNIFNMSGGWVYSFNLTTDTETLISFNYNLNRSDDYENDEYSEILFSLDGALIGQNGNDYIHRSLPYIRQMF